MCNESAEQLPVSLRGVYEVADCVVIPCFFDLPNRFRRSIQRQAHRVRNRPQQIHSYDHKPLKGFQAVPLQSLLHQESGEPEQPLSLHRLQTAISPKGPGSNDRTRKERLLNTITSLPIIFVGLHTIRHRESAAGVQFGASLLGVGLAATAYHASSGKLRKHLRKLDYWSISLSTTAAVRAALPAKSQARARLSSIGLLALVPFQPSAVTAINASIAQVEFARCSQKCPTLRSAHRRQAASLAAGLACFGLEDVAMQHNMGFVHAMWHCLACYAVSSANALIKHKECELHNFAG
ncbi:hypothetical protein WJX77_004254 [Trebouxia sp. C0004]